MSPRHFSNLYRERSHRHDSKRDYEQFAEDMNTITGMLYSIVTLKAFFPSKSPAKNADLTGGPAPYPMPSNSVQCPCGCPPDNCKCCCSKADGCSHR